MARSQVDKMDVRFISANLFCGRCPRKRRRSFAKMVCHDCDEALCDDCLKPHLLLRTYASHLLFSVDDPKPLQDDARCAQDARSTCDRCEIKGRRAFAIIICDDCEEKLCDKCIIPHEHLKTYSTHKTRLIEQNTTDSNQIQMSPNTVNTTAPKCNDISGMKVLNPHEPLTRNKGDTCCILKTPVVSEKSTQTDGCNTENVTSLSYPSVENITKNKDTKILNSENHLYLNVDKVNEMPGNRPRTCDDRLDRHRDVLTTVEAMAPVQIGLAPHSKSSILENTRSFQLTTYKQFLRESQELKQKPEVTVTKEKHVTWSEMQPNTDATDKSFVLSSTKDLSTYAPSDICQDIGADPRIENPELQDVDKSNECLNVPKHGMHTILEIPYSIHSSTSAIADNSTAERTICLDAPIERRQYKSETFDTDSGNHESKTTIRSKPIVQRSRIPRYVNLKRTKSKHSISKRGDVKNEESKVEPEVPDNCQKISNILKRLETIGKSRGSKIQTFEARRSELARKITTTKAFIFNNLNKYHINKPIPESTGTKIQYLKKQLNIQ